MISLHSEMIIKCKSLIDLGAYFCIFSIYEYNRVVSVIDNLNTNRLFASDLEDLKLLCTILLERNDLNNELKQDILNVYHYLEFKINEFSNIKISCARHQMIT